MAKSNVFRLAAFVALLTLVACNGTTVEEIARAYGVSTEEATQIVARVADEASISTDAAASRILSESDLAVQAGSRTFDLPAFLRRADELASDAFDDAVASTYCHAVLMYRATDSVDPEDLYQTLATDFGVNIAEKLWNLNYIGEAVGAARSLAEGDPSGVALVAAEIAYC
jgi:hypothetical protein